jgi:hypothetical protein
MTSPMSDTPIKEAEVAERYAARAEELSEGGKYRWWTDLAALLRSLTARLERAEKALMVVQCAIEEDTTALDDTLWVPERFSPNETLLDYVGAARAALAEEAKP